MASAQHSYLTGDRIAMFYPADFDSAANLPSLALEAEPAVVVELPDSWTMRPEYQKTAGKFSAKVSYDSGVDLYGMGEGVGPLRRNGADVICWNTDNFNYNTDNGRRLYQSHPWIIGVRTDGTAFGILSDNTYRQEIKLNNPIEIISDGPAFRMIIIERESPQEVVQALASLTGKMELPPMWALGYQQSRYSYYPDTRVKEIASTFRNEKLPCDVIWMDIDYMQNFKVFTFSNSLFPDPKGLNDYLHSLNFHSVWMIAPGVKKENGYRIYDEGKAGNHWVLNTAGNEYNGNVWPGSCAFPDFTRPETRNWWGGLYNDFMSKGIDGVWNDMNEPSVFNGPGGTMPVSNLHRGGDSLPAGNHLRYHNVYGMLMVKASRNGILQANPGKRPFVLSRSNFLGGHRYAATWTGDNSSTMSNLRLSIPMSLNLGLSGQPFSGADIGGYSGNATPDLLAHWMAVGAFYPFCRNHTSNNTVSQEPWALGPEAENASRIALQRRYRLLPFLYTLFRDASLNGIPVMQPVFFTDKTDLSLRNEQGAFMWGSSLLIVPKWATDAPMPKGIWRLLSIVGEDSRNDKYQPDLFLKGGSVIPTGKDIQSTAEYASDSLTLLIALDSNRNATGILYADAGEGFGYRDRDYLQTRFTVIPAGDDSVQVSCRSIEGSRQINRTYRSGLVTTEGTYYSKWTTDSSFKIPVIRNVEVNIVSPLPNEKFSANANIHIKAEDHSEIPVSKIEFYYDDTIKIGVLTQQPFEITWSNIPAGLYSIYVKAYSNEGYTYTSKKINIQVGTFGEGRILKQLWDSIPGTMLNNLINDPRFPYYPSSQSFETAFKIPINTGDNYGCRLIGYIHAPKSGNYTFWISGDDYAALYLGTDSTAESKNKIAVVNGWTNPEEWEKYPSQKSISIPLEAGKKYYVEAIMKEGSGGDNLAVAWESANQSREIIAGDFLSPYIPAVPPTDTTVEGILPDFTIYPNPVLNTLNIKVSAGITGTVTLCDAVGRFLLSKKIVATDTHASINVNRFPVGLYYLRINADKTKLVKKILIRKR